MPDEYKMTVTRAAHVLKLTPTEVRSLIKARVLSASTKSGRRGRGQRMYLDPTEVRILRGRLGTDPAKRRAPRKPSKVRAEPVGT